MNQKAFNPTDAELEILRILWAHGPSTVKQVHEYLSDSPPRGYTTILKLLQIMSNKGLVERHKEGRAHVYQASFDADKAQRNLVSEMLNKVFDGSSRRLIMQALSAKPVSRDELEEIRRYIEKMKGELND